MTAFWPKVSNDPVLVKRTTRTLPDGTVEVTEEFQQRPAQYHFDPPRHTGPFWELPRPADHPYRVWCGTDAIEPGNQSGV